MKKYIVIPVLLNNNRNGCWIFNFKWNDFFAVNVYGLVYITVRGPLRDYWHALSFWTLDDAKNSAHGTVKREDWTGRKERQ